MWAQERLTPCAFQPWQMVTTCLSCHHLSAQVFKIDMCTTKGKASVFGDRHLHRLSGWSRLLLTAGCITEGFRGHGYDSLSKNFTCITFFQFLIWFLWLFFFLKYTILAVLCFTFQIMPYGIFREPSCTEKLTWLQGCVCVNIHSWKMCREC